MSLLNLAQLPFVGMSYEFHGEKTGPLSRPTLSKLNQARVHPYARIRTSRWHSESFGKSISTRRQNSFRQICDAFKYQAVGFGERTASTRLMGEMRRLVRYTGLCLRIWHGNACPSK